MIYFLILTISLWLLIYSILAIIAHLPTFKISFKKHNKHKKSYRYQNFVSYASKLIPISNMHKLTLERELKTMGYTITPKEYVCDYTLKSMILVIIALFMYPLISWLAIVPIIGAAIIFFVLRQSIFKESAKKKNNVHKGLPQFVSYMSNRLKSEKDLVNIISDYVQNNQGELVNELRLTLSDMKTGNQETAIKRFQHRINSPFITELCRGIISSMRGDDVTMFFDNLNRKLMAYWSQLLKRQVLKKEPKITRQSYILMFCSIITVFVILFAVMFTALSNLIK